MTKKGKITFLSVWIFLIVALIVAALLVGSPAAEGESIQEAMKDSVLHETNKIAFLGLEVNPALISGFVLTAMLLVAGLIIRLFAIPKFEEIPRGKLQISLESAVDFFDNLAKTNSPHRNSFLGAYLFGAGAFIFLGTLFELLGLQAVTTNGHSIALPAPLADINCAIMMGCLSYLVILSGGLFANGLRGVGSVLKDFSLPISMSFRLFGALLSGALVTELVYHYFALNFGIPVLVGIIFTLIHAIVQTYVLTMLTSVFYGEATERHKKRKRRKK